MITLQADELPMAILSHITEPVEIVNSSGQVVGRFTPDAERIRRLYGSTNHLPDPAELERQLKAEGPGCTTRELFEKLLTLTTDPQERAHLQEKIKELAERDRCPTP